MTNIDLKNRPFYLSDEDIKWVENTKSSMTTEEKIGQLFFPLGVTTDEGYLQHVILNNHVGGLMFRNGKAKELISTYKYLQNNTKIPMLTAANLEAGGDGIIEEGTAFGKQMQVAATKDPKQAYRLGKISCSEAQAVGCNYAFAPVIDIDLNYHNPITNVRTYGSDPEMVKQCGLEYMKAARECGSIVSVKHFPGDGVDEVDQHILISVNSMSCDEWDRTYGDIYKTLIDNDAPTVMVGHIALPAYQNKLSNEEVPQKKLIPASQSKELLQGLLRDKLGFNGMIITDATPMVGFLAAMDRRKAIPYCVEAGCDMILFNKDLEEDIMYMTEGLKNGILSEKRLDEAVTRILATKAMMGLHKKQKQGTLAPSEDNLSEIGKPEYKEWVKDCADKAVTLVKDTQQLLPLDVKKHRRVLYEMMGGYKSDERIEKKFVSEMEKLGFEMIPYEKEVYDWTKPVHFETVEEFRSKYDLVMYIGNIENTSNQTTARLNWHTEYGAGNNIPWFVEVVPTLFISLANPYHLLDVPMIKTYINCYSNHDVMIETVIEKIMGKSEFKGKSPIDPFCGKEYLSY
ncbi:beta-N-acetylhexosaminidase [Pseudobutyrivibrio sp. ACV-2]|uniref:glycoside hydrolase family 3 N-terminal domain-containing protein n=1 Tax=Pseudobutyrivibrio sp. ACV-2 TaxID=1520801 RepID=UPI0008943AD3|nr:glycoside hydrolase family 3 N-terminal domain-containing protein [Pseudobutyrivibrio sp. ACV-2]SDZ89178.1 beta-N-acetylhexosaminidase [Pseudobutyrivibrio sp. ACV-2]